MKTKYNILRGSDRIYKTHHLIVLIMIVLLSSLSFYSLGLLTLPVAIAMVGLSFFLYKLYHHPIIGLFSAIIVGFLANGLSRYITGVPFGLSVDILLLSTYLALYLKRFRTMDWSPAKNEMVLLTFIWFAYTMLQLFNPEASNTSAWFYAMRGVAMYMFITIPLAFVLIKKMNDFNYIMIIWGLFTIIVTLKGMAQLYLGLDWAEQRWLDNGGAVTHILFGKLRVFSFLSDAGQFGGSQAHAGVVGTIMFFNVKGRKMKYFFLLMSLFGFFGMAISGTRGALVIPIVGAFIYMFLMRRVKLIVWGLVFISIFIVFFKFTSIGQSNYTIRRMRTAFNPEDASFQERLKNQLLLKDYLSSRPFGGGLGSSGNWGLRFSPDTFLAQTPTDSWYVQIWAEQGIVGLLLYLGIMIYLLLKCSYIVMFKIKNKALKGMMAGLTAGIGGIMVATYGNGVIGQIPTGILIYLSLALVYMSPKFDDA